MSPKGTIYKLVRLHLYLCRHHGVDEPVIHPSFAKFLPELEESSSIWDICQEPFNTLTSLARIPHFLKGATFLEI
jgi:hypothetical protein